MAGAIRRYEELTGHTLGDVDADEVGPDPTKAGNTGIVAGAAGA